MAFGQASGPPASAAQLGELTELLERVGFDGFREARHPYGLTQRQSNGKFTREEADELIERLTAEVEGGGAESIDPTELPAVPVRRTPPPARTPRGPTAAPPPAPPETDPAHVVLAFPDEMLAEELVRRGWTCTPPGS